MRPLTVGDPTEIGKVGTTDRYRLLGCLGAGGMGKVYLARSPGGRYLAIKMILSEHADDPDFRRRFAREVEAARRVPGVFTAAVWDADPEAERPWLATEYVAGPPLDEAVEQHGPWAEPALRSLGAGIAEGLLAMHRNGLVHRDLKPGNVLISDTGPRLIDFGISRAVDASRLTMTGGCVGTPGFLAPEVLDGAEAGAPADVFAFGALMIYAATARNAYPVADSRALLVACLHRDPDLSGVPDGLAPLLRACMSREPARRPTTTELRDHLGAADGLAAMPPGVHQMIAKRRAPTTAVDTPVSPAARGAMGRAQRSPQRLATPPLVTPPPASPPATPPPALPPAIPLSPPVVAIPPSVPVLPAPMPAPRVSYTAFVGWRAFNRYYPLVLLAQFLLITVLVAVGDDRPTVAALLVLMLPFQIIWWLAPSTLRIRFGPEGISTRMGLSWVRLRWDQIVRMDQVAIVGHTPRCALLVTLAPGVRSPRARRWRLGSWAPGHVTLCVLDEGPFHRHELRASIRRWCPSMPVYF